MTLVAHRLNLLLLFIYYIVEAHIFGLTGRIFVILASFGRFRCNFCFPFRHLTDLPQKFHKGLKTAKFLAVFPTQTQLDGHRFKTVQFSGTSK